LKPLMLWVVTQFEKLSHYPYQRLASRRAGTQAFRQTFIAQAMNICQTEPPPALGNLGVNCEFLVPIRALLRVNGQSARSLTGFEMTVH
jgi:hypothetical protein